MVNKSITNPRQDHIVPHETIYDMLQAYRSTNHPATKMTPYYLQMNQRVRTRLEHFPTETHIAKMSKSEQIWAPNSVKKHTLKMGDTVTQELNTMSLTSGVAINLILD